ncbi:MAG: hypothetical protein ACR2P9_03905 [Gammaproteobacteria bacterium]
MTSINTVLNNGWQTLSQNGRHFAAALLHGFALLCLYQCLEYEIWPHNNPIGIYTLTTLLLTAPIIALLILPSREASRRVVFWLGVTALVLALMGAWMGSQLRPYDPLGRERGLTMMFAVTVLVFCFKAVLCLQVVGGEVRPVYASLIRQALHNTLAILLAWMFMLIVWLLLLLWALLFRAIGVDFFYYIFRSSWFYVPVMVLAFDSALSLTKDHQLIDKFGRNLDVLIRFLLLLVSFVYVLFLGSLIYTGPQVLWGTVGSGRLMLWQFIILFLVNVVYRGSGAISLPWPRWLHRLVSGSVALLPVASLITAWGLYLRINQYGWTVDRCWAVLIWALLALLSFSYLFAIIRWRDSWDDALSRVKINLGLLIMVLMVAVNSPLLDFRNISAVSQFQRMEAEPDMLDDYNFYRYVREKLARPGWLQIQQLRERVAIDDPERAEYIDRHYRERYFRNKQALMDDSQWEKYWQTRQAKMLLWPAGVEMDKSLRDALQKYLWFNYGKDFYPPDTDSHDLALIAMDSAEDGVRNFLLIHVRYDISDLPDSRFMVFRYNEGEWLAPIRFGPVRSGGASTTLSLEAMAAGDVELLPLPPPKWYQQIRIGDTLLSPCVRGDSSWDCAPIPTTDSP